MRATGEQDRQYWQRVDEIFNAVIEMPPSEWAARLDALCGSDAALRADVSRLLRSDGRVESGFLEPGVVMPPPSAPTSAEAKRLSIQDRPGTTIGPYTLHEQIGEGGFGVVYLAEQHKPVRHRVALKIIKPGMDTRQVVARFQAERQALALMDHPHIARVLDGGETDSGRPYFVMELVKGIPITDYCDQCSLPTRERLELFVAVCQAVQHAHQKGIIHRDLKPSNVMIAMQDGQPAPKVIDFGVAKAINQRLTEHTLYTQFSQLVGTPLYMSPEQAEMSPLEVDTRSDIYSLGAMLYELLTGTTPFERERLTNASFDELRRIIRQEEPPPPSSRLSTLGGRASVIAERRRTEPRRLQQVVRGDLDWVVMKALEKDRTRRYETASGFAADVQRHLSGEAVIAAPPSRLYRTGKFIRRNKGSVLAGGLVALGLIIGIGVSTWMFLQERAALARAFAAEQVQSQLRSQAEAGERRAQTEAARSQQVAQFMKDMLKGVGPSVALGRDTTMLRELVDQTVERLSTDLKDQPEVELELRMTLWRVYWDLQLFRKMEETSRETLRLARAHFGEENLAVADALGQHARSLFYLRVHDEAETLSRQAIAMQRKLRGPDSVQESDSVCTLGDILRHKGKLDEAESACRECLAMRRRLLDNDSTDVAWALNTLSIVLQNANKLPEAEATAREALAIHRRIYGDEHPATAANLSQLGFVLNAGSADRFEEAESCFRSALAIQERTEGKGGRNQLWTHSGLGYTLERLGKLDEAEIHYREAAAHDEGWDFPDVRWTVVWVADFLRKRGRLSEAEALLRKAIIKMEPSLGDAHPELANALHKLGDVLRDSDNWNEAEETFRKAVAIRGTLFGDEHLDLAHSLHGLAWVVNHNGKPAEAEALSREELAMRRNLLGNDHPDVAMTLEDLAVFLSDQGKHAEAETAARDCLSIRERSMPDDFLTFRIRGTLGGILLEQLNLQEAEPLLLSSYEGMAHTEDDASTHCEPCLKEAVERLIRLYELWDAAEPSQGYAAKAADWQAELDRWQTGTQPSKNHTASP